LERVGANIRATDSLGRNALHIAVQSGKTDAIPFLVERGVAMDEFDNQGLTPIHYAMGQFYVFRVLLSAGGQVDTPDSNGRTPLHWAAMLSTPAITNGSSMGLSEFFFAILAEDLLEKGADPSIRDRFGKTPADLAREKGAIEIQKLIERAQS
jgi:ankyrin repeat protein